MFFERASLKMYFSGSGFQNVFFGKSSFEEEINLENVFSEVAILKKYSLKKYFLRKHFWGKNFQNALLQDGNFENVFLERVTWKGNI